MNYLFIAVAVILGTVFGINTRMNGTHSRGLEAVLGWLVLGLAAVALWWVGWQTAVLCIVAALVCGRLGRAPVSR